ncbi:MULTISPECIES: hypothetical protein [unclassified Comamonas]|uniref:hypothetical protein n=1 Tax=unclassified Comamonas TaxID=2638500 RepID=UPI001FA7EE13|nr:MULTISPECIES: hypothetical protein [unclassified Comamonas]UNV89398.1 hypothetical protein MP576_17540 [Comamonas sp. 7D-2evo1]UNV97304.1 hypothetical protein MPZ60_08865 [Comamonas sp. 7D-2]UNV99042.1 hypothetical protein MP579_17545 [Comamonas sp. 7D-2evo2]
MKKAHAIELLGGTPKKAAAAMGYRSIQAVYLWPDVLPQATADRVRGVLSRVADKKAADAQQPKAPSNV